MATSSTNRLSGVAGALAIKAPVRVATTIDITLSGLQTIDGVAVVADNRVLVKDQDTASENGIYNASSGDWTRAVDFNGNRDAVEGTRVLVNQGSTYVGTQWYVSTTGAITIGTTSITFTVTSLGSTGAHGNGTEALPGMNFASDPDTGWYRIGANNLGASVGGTKTVDVSSAGLDVTQGAVLQGGGAIVPTGTVLEYAGTSAPTGFLLCDGTEYSETTYATLFAILSTTYNTGGETAGFFRVPDRTGRVAVGKEASETRITSAGAGINGGTLGATGGTETHTLVLAEHAAHDHGGVTGSMSANTTAVEGVTSTGNVINTGTNADIPDAASSIDHTHTIASSGSDTAHQNTQPSIVMNFIIKI